MNVRAVRIGSAGITIEQHVAAPPAPNEVLIQPELIGVSWFDAHAAHSAKQHSGSFVPGHECVGVVTQTSDHATALRGQRVVVSPDVVCGVCDLCRSGLSAHCRERKLLGSPACDGCMRTLAALPALNVTPIAESLDGDIAIFALPLARALHAAWIVHLEGRPYVTVLGRGAEALLAAQAMTKLNASVRVVTECENTLNAADRLGLRHRPLGYVGRRADQDVIVDVSAPGQGLSVAAHMVRPRGKIVLLRPLTPPSFTIADAADVMFAVENEVEIIGCRGARVREAVAMLERGEVGVEGLITQRFKLDRADHALKAAADASQLKVVVEAS